MSRRTRERRLEAGEQWPNLQRLLQECFDEDISDRSRLAETALDQAIGRRSLETLQVVAREWWNWNATRSWLPGGMAILSNGLEAVRNSPEHRQARQYMNAVYEKLIVAIRAEAGKDWRPDTRPAEVS